MTKNKLAKLFFVLMFSNLFLHFSTAQENITDYFKITGPTPSQTISNVEYFSGEYLNPFGKMLGSNLNGGWYNTGKPHKLGGFDLTITTSMSTVASSDKTFDISDMPGFRVKSGSPISTPTISGGKDDYTTLEVFANVAGEQKKEFNTPKGADLRFFPAPMINLGVGLPLGIELRGRFVPSVELSDYGKLSLWGIGLKKGINDMIPGMKLFPVQLAFFAGYTNFKSNFNLDFQPKDYAISGLSYDKNVSYDNQSLDFDAGGFTTQLLISKSIPVLTFYAGLGYSKVTSSFKLKGNYPVLDYQGASNSVAVRPFSDPISVDMSDVKGFQYTGGIRIKLAIITFHFDYTKSEYPVYTGGFGISFR